MIQHPNQRIAIYTDVQNLYYAARNLYNDRVNYTQLLELAVAGRQLVRAFAYVIRAENAEENRFFDALFNIGFEVREKDLQVYAGRSKGDWGVGMSIDAVQMADKTDVAVLITGDGDFVPLVEYLRFKGVMVEIICFGRTTSNKLIESADQFIDLDYHYEEILLGTQQEQEHEPEV